MQMRFLPTRRAVALTAIVASGRPRTLGKSERDVILASTRSVSAPTGVAATIASLPAAPRPALT